MNKEGIEFFARDILGCGCGPEVFELIEKEDNLLVPGAGIIRHKLLIGKRLLIYLYEPASPVEEEKLEVLLKAGVAERDANNYNRFRLAVVAEITDELAARAEELLNRIKGEDEKVHLHILKPGEVSGIVF